MTRMNGMLAVTAVGLMAGACAPTTISPILDCLYT